MWEHWVCPYVSYKYSSGISLIYSFTAYNICHEHRKYEDSKTGILVFQHEFDFVVEYHILFYIDVYVGHS